MHLAGIGTCESPTRSRVCMFHVRQKSLLHIWEGTWQRTRREPGHHGFLKTVLSELWASDIAHHVKSLALNSAHPLQAGMHTSNERA